MIERGWGTSAFPPPASTLKLDNNKEPWDVYHDLEEPARCIPEIEDVVDIEGKLLCQQPEYNKIIKNAEVLL